MLGFMSFFCILLSLYLKGRKYEVFLGEFYHTSKITSCLLIVSADAGDGKGKCGFTVILAAVKRNL